MQRPRIAQSKNVWGTLRDYMGLPPGGVSFLVSRSYAGYSRLDLYASLSNDRSRENRLNQTQGPSTPQIIALR